MKKLYFCGSIRGGRQDAALYAELIAALSRRFAVLTEHIGAANLEQLEQSKTDTEIWKQDTDWLRECDLVVAEASVASLGVGYELHLAKTLGKPTFVLFRAAEGLSAMIAGDSYYRLLPYRSREELFSLLEGID